jgi:capsular exopolysaccharide synthesis family protein
MKNDYVRGGQDPNTGGYGGYGSGGYGGYGSGGYGGYGSGSYGSYGYGGGGGGGNGPTRSFKDYIQIFQERIWYLVVTFFIIFSGSILYTFNKTKVYTAVAQVQLFRDDSSALGNTVEMEQNQIRTAEDLNTQISLLESITIIQAVEQRMQEDLRARFMAPYADAFSLSGPLTPTEILMRNRKILPRRMSLMIGVAFSHPDPIIASEIANFFANEFIDYNLKLNIDASMKAVEDLRIRADQQKDRVEELDLKLSEYREANNAVSLDNQENIAGVQLARLNEIKLTNKNVYDQLETKWNLIDSYMREGRNLWELSFVADQPRVSGLLERISSTRIQISSLSKRYREKHPAMIQVLQTLQEAELELGNAVKNAVDKTYAGFTEAKSNFEVSSRRLAEKEKELIDLSKTRVEYSSLLRDLEVQHNFFNALNQRMTTEKAQVNLKNPNARVVDQAFPPPEDQPSSPNIVMNLAAGFFGGIATGFGLIFVIAFMDDRVKSAFDIEGTIGLPLLGVIPRIKKLDAESKAQAVASNVDRHVTETFRTIYSSIKLNEGSKNAKVILSTSTVPAEGKSFVSTNLGLTFASHGEKTLLVDADLRLPSIARTLQLENSEGVIDHVVNGATLDDLIIKDVYPNIDVLPSGGKSKSPTQVLGSAIFENMFSELRERYDRIVVDSPPLAAVSDALNLLKLVDGVVYVIKYNTVKRRTASINVRRLWESDTPVFGALLNNISSAHSSYYYSQYSDKAYRDYYISRDEDEDLEEEISG